MWAHWEKFCGLFLRKLFYCPIERSNKSKTFDLCGRVIAWESNCVTLRNFSWLKSLSRYCMYWQFTYSTGRLYFQFCVWRNKIPAKVTSENMNVIPANIFTADKNCCWLDWGGGETEEGGSWSLTWNLERGVTNPSATPTYVILKCIFKPQLVTYRTEINKQIQIHK